MASPGLSGRDETSPAQKYDPPSIQLDEPRDTPGSLPADELKNSKDVGSNSTSPQDIALSNADTRSQGFALTQDKERKAKKDEHRIRALEDAGLDRTKIQDVLAALDRGEEEDSLAEDVEKVRQASTRADFGGAEEPGSAGGEEKEEDDDTADDKDDQEKSSRLAEQKAGDFAKPPQKKKKRQSSKPSLTEWERQAHEEGAKVHGRRLEADLRKSGLDESEIASIMKRRANTDKVRPVYTKIALQHIAPETLDRYGMPWEYDVQDPNYIVVKRFLPQNETDFLFEHTRKIRQRQDKETRSRSQRIARIQRNDTAVDMPLAGVAARPRERIIVRKERNSGRKSSRFGFYPGKVRRGRSPMKSANLISYSEEDFYERAPRPQRLDMYTKQQVRGHPEPRMPPTTDTFDDTGLSMKATIVDFKPGRDHFIGMLRPLVMDLLEGPGPEALMVGSHSRHEASKIRWIHLPANNMSWVESLMSRVYSERPSFRPEPPSYKMIRQDLLLKHELWSGLQHRASNGQVHARFMRPFCSSISTDPTFSNISQTKNNIVAYLPYLNWEYSKHQQTMSEVVADLKELEDLDRAQDPSTIIRLGTTLDERLMRLYLNKDPPLHIRRTLDQSYYYTLDNTDERDRDQVVYRHTREMLDGDPLLMMVDQLWMWVIDGDTIITSFPQRWGKPQYDGLQADDDDVLELLLMKMSSPSFTVSSAYDVALAIIEQCCNVFYNREQAQRPELQFFEFFVSAIGSVTQAQIKSFDDFWTILSDIRQLDIGSRHRYQQNAFDDEVVQLKVLHQRLGDINTEILLQKEIKDVLDELSMIQRIYDQQHAVVSTMAREMKTLPGELKFALDPSSGPLQVREPTNAGPIERAEELLRTIDSRSREITEMQNEAEKTYGALSDLLDLKQRQANVQEARSAREMAEDSAEQTKESIKQGRTIMVFTVVTIIFLPLSFIASVFGMNAKEINGGTEGSSIPLGIIFAYMFPIGLFVTLLALTIAFSRSLRQKLKNATFSQDTRGMNRTQAGYEYDHQNIVERLFKPIWRGIKVSIHWLRGSEYPKVLDDSDYGSRDRYQPPRRVTTHHAEIRGYDRPEPSNFFEDASFDRIDLRRNPRQNHFRMRKTDTSISRDAPRRPSFLR